MKAFGMILTIFLVFGLAMGIIACVNNENERYDPIYHLDQIVEGFKEIPSFEQLKWFTSADSFVVPSSQAWRFRGFHIAETADFLVIYPDFIREQDWGVFEWLNEPMGALVSFFVRANGVTWWLTEWLVSFFKNVGVLLPSSGMVERSA